MSPVLLLVVVNVGRSSCDGRRGQQAKEERGGLLLLEKSGDAWY
jgi:hypothetical protein